MPEIESLPANMQKQYLGKERAVNIRQTLQSQEQKEKSGLNGIEVRGTPQSLGKDDFLKLLVTQLSYQDPTSPVKDQQFIAQMAQFSSLEQMQNMASSLSRLADRQAHNLIGRYVVGPDFVSGEQTGGTVQALFYDENNKAFLKVGGRAVALDKVQMIGDPGQIQAKYGGLGAGAESTRGERAGSEKLSASPEQKEARKELEANKNQSPGQGE